MSSQQFTSEHNDRVNAPNHCIIITDGVHTVDTDTTEYEALLAQETIDMVAVGVTDDIDVGLLQILSSEPKREHENYYRSPEFDMLGSFVDQLVQRVRCVVPVSG